MQNKYIEQLKKIVLDELKSQNIKIFMFGSRARRDNYIGSDVDIGLIPESKIDSSKISLLKEKIDNSNIPYKVQIVNFKEVSERFKNEAMKDIEIWKD